MDGSKKISPVVPLRLGLGAMYVYSGYNLIAHPGAWTWAVPAWFQGAIEVFVPIEQYLRIQGGIELGLAAVFLAWFLPSKVVLAAAVVSFAEVGGILLLAPLSQFIITFRDLGILGASAALVLLNLKK